MPILEVQHICKTFGDTQVLKDISFTLEKGEALSMIGTSGSGKTTLLRCLNFLETPTSGKILVNDKPVFDSETAGRMSEAQVRENRLHFGMVFQNFNLFPQYTALENVTLAKKLIEQKKPEFKTNKEEYYHSGDISRYFFSSFSPVDHIYFRELTLEEKKNYYYYRQ